MPQLYASAGVGAGSELITSFLSETKVYNIIFYYAIYIHAGTLTFTVVVNKQCFNVPERQHFSVSNYSLVQWIVCFQG